MKNVCENEQLGSVKQGGIFLLCTIPSLILCVLPHTLQLNLRITALVTTVKGSPYSYIRFQTRINTECPLVCLSVGSVVKMLF